MDKKEELKKNSINVHQRLGTDVHITSDQMDTERLNTITYDYLCRLEEAKSWIGEITKVPESYEDFEEEMRKGFFLAEVAKFYSPESVGSIFIDSTLQYRHTDNINYFLRSLVDLGLPKYFYFEVIDLYEKKNFPKVVYCVHALAHFLRSKGKTGGIISAKGKVFDMSDIERMDSELASIKMPRFDNIQKDIDSHKESEEEDMEDVKNKVRAELLLEEENLIIEANYRTPEVPELTVEDKITLKFRSFLYAKAFDDIYYKKNVSLFSIRKFLFVFFKTSVEMLKENAIDDLHKKINNKLKDIYNKEIYLEDIENRIGLMIQNKLDLYKIEYKKPFDDEFNLKPMQDILQLLQTNPFYLANLFEKVEDQENFISTVVLPLFNNVSGKKEEYLFINLVLEIFNRNKNTSNIIMENDLSYKLMVNYFRVSKEGEVFRNGLYGIVKNLDNIEIECNPTEIYRGLYDSIKSLDESLENKRVYEIYETRLSVVRGVLKSIFDFIQNNINNIPFILRYFLKEHGAENFIKDFIFPFFLAGDVFDSQFKISNTLRNKAYKITNLISWFVENINADGETNLIPEDMTVYAPIFDFLKDTSVRYKTILNSILGVTSLDHYFQLESINELVRVQKSMIYLPVRVVNGLITLLKNNEKLFDQYIGEYIDELELLPDENNVILTFSLLNSDWVNHSDEEEVALENFIKNTKRKLIYLIKICKGRNVMELLLGDCSDEEREIFNREKYYEYVSKQEESNIEDETLEELKEGLIDDFRFLEEKGIVFKDNLYSEILSLLANDIIVLKFMSLERSKELKVNELTYSNLLAKEDYLDAKMSEYDEYIESYCSRMAIKKASYDSNSPIVKLNKESKYGSYHFTSTELFEMNILNQVYEVPDARDIFFILVSNKPLIFGLEVYINNLLISNPYDFRFEDILAMRRNKNETFNVLNVCSFNTENFIKLLNEKYIMSK
jgi:Ras GTPase-activating-like protein IQGAP2/3